MIEKVTALIILNYNNYEDTINCVESVLKYNTAKVKFIVIDNGSPRGGVVGDMKKYIEDKSKNSFVHLYDKDLQIDTQICLPDFTFIESHMNDGYAAGNNKGLNLAERDETITHVMILNNDVLFVEDIIPMLIEQEKQLTDAAFISPLLYTKGLQKIDYTCARENIKFKNCILNMWLIPLEKLFHISKNYTKSRYLLNNVSCDLKSVIPIDLPSGSCMFIRKSKFKTINFFDPNTFLYYEENILHKKIQRQGWQNYLIPFVKCIHLGAQSTSSSNTAVNRYSRKSQEYYFKNYCNLNIIQKILLSITYRWFDFWVFINKKIKL